MSAVELRRSRRQAEDFLEQVERTHGRIRLLHEEHVYWKRRYEALPLWRKRGAGGRTFRDRIAQLDELLNRERKKLATLEEGRGTALERIRRLEEPWGGRGRRIG